MSLTVVSQHRRTTRCGGDLYSCGQNAWESYGPPVARFQMTHLLLSSAQSLQAEKLRLRSLWAPLAEKAQTVAAEMDDQSVSQAESDRRAGCPTPGRFVAAPPGSAVSGATFLLAFPFEFKQECSLFPFPTGDWVLAGRKQCIVSDGVARVAMGGSCQDHKCSSMASHDVAKQHC